MTEYTYGPGEWTALAHGGRAALLDPAIDPESVATIWDSLSQAGSLESWLEVLAGRGLASLPSFGLVEPGDDGVRVVVRGSVTGVVAGQEISAGGMRTWREHIADPDSAVVLRVAEADVRHPLIGGLVLAATIQIGEVPQPADDEPSAESTTEGEPAADQASPVVAAAAEAAADEEPAVEETEQVLDPAQESEEEPTASVAEQPAPEPEPEPEPAPAEPEAEAEPDFVLDEDDESDEADVQAEQEPAETSAAPLAPPAPQPWAVPAQPAPQAEVWGPPVQQEQQPWHQQAPPASQPADAEFGDHDGYTMRASDLPQAAEESPVDHTLAPAQEGFEDEPAHDGPVMQLSLSTGQQVELDRPVLIGRAPESSRFGFGETPRLVTVPSPQQDISRTHVEIKAEGDSVLVTDLRSTNGTVVVLPGAPPRRLHPGESVPVPTGTVVDLGDGVTAVVGQPGTAAPLAY